MNTLTLPLRLFLSHEQVNRMGLWSMRDERCDIAMSYCEGRLLDIGCGNNQLVKKYGHDSVGVDVHDFGGDALILEDTSNMPFDDASFQTVSFIASFGHIPNREVVLKEAYRLLTDDGHLLATMLIPCLGVIRHKLAWWDRDQHERGMKEGEVINMPHKQFIKIIKGQGFRLVRRIRFTFWLNNLYIFRKEAIKCVAEE